MSSQDGQFPTKWRANDQLHGCEALASQFLGCFGDVFFWNFHLFIAGLSGILGPSATIDRGPWICVFFCVASSGDLPPRRPSWPPGLIIIFVAGNRYQNWRLQLLLGGGRRQSHKSHHQKIGGERTKVQPKQARFMLFIGRSPRFVSPTRPVRNPRFWCWFWPYGFESMAIWKGQEPDYVQAQVRCLRGLTNTSRVELMLSKWELVLKRLLRRHPREVSLLCGCCW